MKVTITKLQKNTDELLKLVAGGENIIITENGREVAKLIPYTEISNNAIDESNYSDELFGIWKDRDDIPDVNAYIRQIRKNRFV